MIYRSCISDKSIAPCHSKGRAAVHISSRPRHFPYPSNKGKAAVEGLLSWLQGSAEDTSLKVVPCSRTSCAPEQALHQATFRPLRERLRALQAPASPSDRTPHCAVTVLRAYRCFHTVLIVQGSVRNRRIITLFTL